MNNLHRELAPISDAAWAQIEEETARTFKRYLAGRRVVDVRGPAGADLSAVGTGHLRPIAGLKEGVVARQRVVKALVELRFPFELDRQTIDDVERGANDSDWQPAKHAARQIAFAETARFLRAIPQPASWEFVRGQAIRRCLFRPTFASTRMPLPKP